MHAYIIPYTRQRQCQKTLPINAYNWFIILVQTIRDGLFSIHFFLTPLNLGVKGSYVSSSV
jgi:hypothetical protein